MEKKPIRVLHVFGKLTMGGAESRVMELYRAIDRDEVQFDFIVHYKGEFDYSEEIRNMGGNIYTLPTFKMYNYFQYKKAVRDFFANHQEFTTVHGHMTSTAAIYLPIAKKEYAKNGKNVVTVAHARSAGVDKGAKGKLTRFLRRNLSKKTDYNFTCSNEAGVSVFGQKAVDAGNVITIPNAINLNRFKYDINVRNEVRKELGFDGKVVLGHVGRFNFMKNHKYIVEILNELCKERKDIVLAFIGSGVEEENINTLVKELGLKDKVFFLGNRKDVERYYQAFDYFVFPSVFEGLPGSVVEAQAAGLKCIISDTITKEVVLSPLVKEKSIEVPAKEWAKEILQDLDSIFERPDVFKELKEAGFDVNSQAKQMELFYQTGSNPPGRVNAINR